MKRFKIVVAVAAAVLLFFVALAAGINAVFSVGEVRLELTFFSSLAKEEGEKLKGDLDCFLGKSTIFLKEEEVIAVAEEYSRYEVTAVEKAYPRTVIVRVSEREETYAVQGETGYTLLDKNGRVIGESDKNENSVDGAENILLSDVTLSGNQLSEESLWITAFVNAFSQNLPDVRMNVKEISCDGAGGVEGYASLRMKMREGVEIVVYDPREEGEKKAGVACEKYLSLSDGEKEYGRLVVFKSNVNGEIEGTYSPASSTEE